MNNRKTIAFAVISLLVIGIAAFVAWPPNGHQSTRSIGEAFGRPGNQERTEAFNSYDELPDENSTEVVASTFDCSPDDDSIDLDLHEVAAALSRSQDPEHLLIAALYGQDPTHEARLPALINALTSAPADRLILWNLLVSCAQTSDEPMCLDLTIESRAIAVDGGNGQLWASVAGYRVKRGDMQGALDALKKAAVAPEFDDYRTEHIELFERGLAAAGVMNYGNRIIAAIGMQAAMGSNEIHTFNGCKIMAPESQEWLSQCVRLGERLEREGRSYFSGIFGLGLQKRMYSISGNKKMEASAQERSDILNQDMAKGFSKDVDILLSRDDQVLANFISESATFGELKAFQFLGDEIERLKALPGYDPCSL